MALWRVVHAFIVAQFPLAAPRGERSGATTLPLRPPCQFAHSPLHTHTATRGRRVCELAVPLSRRSWRRFSHAPSTLSAFGEPANQRHGSCKAEASFRLMRRTQLSRRCFADSPRRAPACAGAAHSRAFFRNAAHGTCGYIGMFPPPSRRLQIASHYSALVAAIGVPAAPADDLGTFEKLRVGKA